jgi:hypothetical protein
LFATLHRLTPRAKALMLLGLRENIGRYLPFSRGKIGPLWSITAFQSTDSCFLVREE